MALKFKKRKASRKNPSPKRRRRARRNPAAKIRTRTRTRTVVKYRTRRAKSNPRRSRRRTRRNPSGRGIWAGIKAGAPYVLGIGGGAVVGLFGVKYIPTMVPVRVRGVVPALIGLILGSVSRSVGLRNFGYGLGAAGLVDLVRNNVPMFALSEITTLQEIPALQAGEMYTLTGNPLNTLGADPLNTLGGDMQYAVPNLGDFDMM